MMWYTSFATTLKVYDVLGINQQFHKVTCHNFNYKYA